MRKADVQTFFKRGHIYRTLDWKGNVTAFPSIIYILLFSKPQRTDSFCRL